MSEKKLSIQKSVMWNSLGSIFYLGCQWLITVLVVRLSGVDAAGDLSLAMSVCNIWYCLAVYGMRNYQVSDTTHKYSQGTYIFSRIVTCFGAFVGCLIYSMAVSYSAHQRLCIILYYIYKMTEAVYDVYAGVFQIEWRLDLAGKSMLARGILSIGGFCLILKMSGNILAAIAAMAVLCGLEVIVFDMRVARRISKLKPDFNLKLVTALLIECLPLVVYTLLSSAIGSIPRLFMERIMDGYSLGIYGSVATPTLIIQMCATYVFNPFVTLFAERYNGGDRAGFMGLLGKCCQVVLGIAIAGIIGGKLLGRWGLNLLYGSEVAEYEELLIPLIICTILTAFAWLLCGVLTAIREFKGLIVGNLTAVIVSAVLSFFLEKSYGMQGASMALAAATIVEAVVMYIYMLANMKKQFADA